MVATMAAKRCASALSIAQAEAKLTSSRRLEANSRGTSQHCSAIGGSHQQSEPKQPKNTSKSPGIYNMTDKPEKTKQPKLVEIGHVSLSAWGFLHIARRLDCEAAAIAAHVTWPSYSADGFRGIFEREDLEAKMPRCVRGW
jgi:hypothetical protein